MILWCYRQPLAMRVGLNAGLLICLGRMERTQKAGA